MSKPVAARQQFESKLAALAEKFKRHHADYKRADYSEAQARLDFVNPFFEALGWDVRNEAGLGPKEREVVVEQGQTTGRPDYNFRLDGRTVFFVEAKAPHVPIDRADVIMQAKSYAWSSQDVFVSAVTDFEEIRLYDASVKPDRKHPDVGLIFAHQYTDYLKPKTLDELWLLSREAVAGGSIDQLLKMSGVKARQKLPVDQAFLDDLTEWRERLAKAVFKSDPEMDVADLNSVVQVFLDRLIFIRIAEDRGILPPRGLEDIARAWEHSGKRRPLAPDLNALFHEVNRSLNGEIFKPHLCEKVNWDADSALAAGIIGGLYFPHCPYRFDAIGVELLGSIYERYLGKTIRVTATRAVVEEKPEVRKAGGVYYTPRYIVDYIVENTVGKLIEGRTPRQIAKLKILDPACGSGSFLLGAYQKLLDYHEQYYAAEAAKRKKGASQPALIGEGDGGGFKLPLEEKAAILRNNIYGVDIDPQAVEITMMSLYIKMLEGERGAIKGLGVLPPLRNNIKCGNSLIGHDIGNQPDLFGELAAADLHRLNPFDWESKSEGFGEIMAAGGFDVVIGNPPWLMAGYHIGNELDFLRQHYTTAQGKFDLYYLFIELGLRLLAEDGLFGMIVPNKFFHTRAATSLRALLSVDRQIRTLIDFGDEKIFAGATNYSCILLLDRNRKSPPTYIRANRDLEIEKQIEIAWSSLGEDTWHFEDSRVQRIFEKLERNGEALESITERFGTGVQSGSDRLLILTPDDIKILKLEKRAGTPILRGRDVRRYSLSQDPKMILFPYEVIDGEFSILDEKVLSTKYPALYAYLTDHRKQLSARIWFDKNAMQLSGHWYSLMYMDKHSSFSKPHILTPSLSNMSNFTLGGGMLFVTGTAGVTSIIPAQIDEAIEYLLGILNSKVLSFYAIRHSPIFQGSYFKFSAPYLKKLPIRRINFSDPADKKRHDDMVALVERMLALHKQKAEAKSEAARERIEREINVTDEKIDGLVYELYGLTEAEIKVVEGG